MAYFKAHFKAINNKGNKDTKTRLKSNRKQKNKQKRHISGVCAISHTHIRKKKHRIYDTQEYK